MNTPTLVLLAAFATEEGGGNPAGVWIGEELPSPEEMQDIAADVGFSETAFLAPSHGDARTIRYFSPEREVTFCGHATIAAGVVLGRGSGPGEYTLETVVGPVTVTAAAAGDDFEAALVSVPPRFAVPDQGLVRQALDLLGWSGEALDDSIQPAMAYAGAWHLVIAVADRAVLSRLAYDFEAMRSLMEKHGLTTLQLIYRESPGVIHARNPFPVGGVFEDPATGAAAAALGGYLRDSGRLAAPARFVVRQGDDMGRPSVLHVFVPEEGGIEVRGRAHDI